MLAHTLIMRFLTLAKPPYAMARVLASLALVTLYNIASSDSSDAVWPSGKALGWKTEGNSVRFSFSCPFSSKLVVYGRFVSFPTTSPSPPHPQTYTHIHSQLMCKGPVEAARCRPESILPWVVLPLVRPVVHHVLFL